MTQRFSLFLFSAESYFADKDAVLLLSLRVAICHQVQKLFCFQVSNAFIIIRQDFHQVRFKKTQSTRQPGMQTTQVWRSWVRIQGKKIISLSWIRFLLFWFVAIFITLQGEKCWFLTSRVAVAPERLIFTLKKLHLF